MEPMLSDATAFVTGASRGIGRQIARTLADRGANVAIAARSDAIHDVVDEIGAERALAVETDVTDEESVRTSIEETVEHFGGLDALINNAGVAGPIGPVEDLDREDWDHALAVNVTGPFLTVKHAAPHLRESDRGSVVNISTITGKRPKKERASYATTKIGVVRLTRTLALELGDDGVTVNAICPSATESPRIDGFVQNHAEETGLDYEAAKADLGLTDNALGTLVTPDDTAELIAFLVSEKGEHITAQDINVDAGTIWY
ncbi:MAG: SDR family NAD(P)-dependent oxidoreductase [Halobacteriota archaeon]